MLQNVISKFFLYLNDSHPRSWLGKLSHKLEINDLRKDKKFISDKYYLFLKRILIPREVYEAAAAATLSKEKKCKEFADHKCNKTEELKKTLLDLREFRTYVLNNPDVIDKIVKEFEEYNRAEKHLALHVDANVIKANFEKTRKEIVVKQGKSNVKISIGIGLLVIASIALITFVSGPLAPVVYGVGAIVGAAVTCGMTSGTLAIGGGSCYA